jgi:hypothetical protein
MVLHRVATSRMHPPGRLEPRQDAYTLGRPLRPLCHATHLPVDQPGSAVAWCGRQLGTGVSCPSAACHRPASLYQTGRGTSGGWSSGKTRRAPRGHRAIVARLSAPHNPGGVPHTTSAPPRISLLPWWDISRHRCYTLRQAGSARAASPPSMHETPAKEADDGYCRRPTISA